MAAPWEKFKEEPQKDQGTMGPAHPADQFVRVEDPGILEKTITVIDEVTGAPVRLGLKQMLEGDFGKGLSTMTTDVRVPEREAPTGFEVAEAAGLPGKKIIPPEETTQEIIEPSEEIAAGLPTGIRSQEVGALRSVVPAEAAGLGVDLLADRTAYIGTVLKGGFKSLQWMLRGSQAAIESTKLGKVGSATQRAAKKAAKAHTEQLYKAGQALDYEELKGIAEANGIDVRLLPESIEFGKESGIARQAAKVRAGPAGQPMIEDLNEVVRQVSHAFDKKIDEISGGRALDPEEAGQFIRDSVEQTVKEKIGKLDETYNNILFGKRGPDGEFIIAPEKGLILSDEAKADFLGKLRGAKRKAKKIAEGSLGAGTPRVKANRQLLNRIEALEKAQDDLPTLLEIWRDIGEEAFGPQIIGEVSPDRRQLMNLYFDTSGALQKTIKDFVSPEFAKNLKENNRIISDLLSDKNMLIKEIRNPKKGGKEVFSSTVLKGTPQAQALKNILTPEQFQVVRGAYLKSLVKENIAGEKPVRTMFNTLRGRKRLTDIYFSQEYGPRLLGDEKAAQQLQEFTDLMKFSDRIGVKFLSSSETGAVIEFSKPLKESVKDMALLEASKQLARQRGPKAATRATEIFRTPQKQLLGEIMQDVRSLKTPIVPKTKKRAGLKALQFKGARDERERRRRAMEE